MPDLNQMVVFERVVREGSFTAAARALGQPKSTVSKRVAELEARLGARLLHRSTRRLRTTEEGAAYYEHCRRIVRDAELADGALADRDGAPRGLVRITGPAAVTGFLSPLAERYLKAYPEVALEIVLLDRRVNLIEEGFDLALRAGPLRDSALVARRLGVSERVLVAHPSYLAARGTPKKPAHLRVHDCIAIRSEPGTIEWTLEKRPRVTARVAVSGRYTVSSAQLARDGALAGFGIANLPRFIVTRDLAERRLVEVLPAWPVKRGEIHLLYPSNRQLSPRVRLLVEMIVEWFAQQKR